MYRPPRSAFPTRLRNGLLATEGNGHFYQFVPDLGITWPHALVDAQSRAYGGVAGHLATITSQAENDFIKAHCLNYSYGAWLGGWQDEGHLFAEGWHWVTDGPWDFTNWHPVEPNDTGEDELYLDIMGNDAYEEPGFWNDSSHMRASWWTAGYIVEYPVPEPATLSLLALGGLAMLRRRKADDCGTAPQCDCCGASVRRRDQ